MNFLDVTAFLIELFDVNLAKYFSFNLGKVIYLLLRETSRKRRRGRKRLQEVKKDLKEIGVKDWKIATRDNCTLMIHKCQNFIINTCLKTLKGN